MGKGSSFSGPLRILLVVGALAFIAVQVRVLLLGSECAANLHAVTEQNRQLVSDSFSIKQQLARIAREAAAIEAENKRLRVATSYSTGSTYTTTTYSSPSADYSRIPVDETAVTTIRLGKSEWERQTGGEREGGGEGGEGGAAGGDEAVSVGRINYSNQQSESKTSATSSSQMQYVNGQGSRLRGSGANSNIQQDGYATTTAGGANKMVIPLAPAPGPSQGELAVAAVVVMACNRVGYLERTLKSILHTHNGSHVKFPLFLSQDGKDVAVHQKALHSHWFTYLQHIEDAPPVMNSPNENIAYYRISNHYKFALTELFDKRHFKRVIILEDDMELSPDFFDYFEATAKLLDEDSSLMAVSSWNDNGQDRFVSDPELLYRSDFFPGLGWMLTSSLWSELKPKWPKAYWDDWLRLPEQRLGRQTVRPEVCRTYNFGEYGSSFGQFFRDYLAPIQLNKFKVDWAHTDLSYLTKDNYLAFFKHALANATIMRVADVDTEVLSKPSLERDIILTFRDEASFAQLASKFGIFQEWKAGIPRVSYEGVVAFRFKGPHLVYFVQRSSMARLGLQ